MKPVAPENQNGVYAAVQLTPLQMRVEKARNEYDAQATVAHKIQARINNLTARLTNAAVLAGQKREKWLILLAMQEQQDGKATV